MKILNKVKKLYNKVKYAFQRMFRGYGDDELIDFDIHFVERTMKMLNDIHSNVRCFPATKVPTLSQWKWKIRQMMYYLKRMDESYYWDENAEDYAFNYESRMQMMEEAKDEFFKLFNEYFYNLWIKK